MRPDKAWRHSFTLGEIPEHGYLANALNGEHGVEGTYAAIRVNGEPVGASDRAVSYPSNTWEYPPRKAGAEIDAVVLGMRGGAGNFEPEVWITVHPHPFRQRTLCLER